MNREILIVIGSLSRGGAETHLSQVLPKLVEKNLDIAVHLLSGVGELAEPMQKQGVRIISPWISRKLNSKALKAIKIMVNSVQLFFYLLFKRPRVVHFFLPQSYLIGGLLSVLAASPVRLMSRRSMNYYQNKYSGFVRKLEYWLHTKMTYVLGNSQKVVDQLESEEGVGSHKTRLIYNGLSIKAGPDFDFSTIVPIPDNSVVLVMVANLIPYKGHGDLIEALSQLRVAQRWDMVFIGNDSTGICDALKEQANQKGIGERVHFLGKRSDVNDILQKCHIGVLASHEEGFSNAILEGMAAGLAMVVTDVGGNGEAILDKECGLVVPPKSPKEMAMALQLLIERQELRMDYGRVAQARFLRHFQLETCVQSYAELYNDLIKRD